jgi:hypothetical protein
MDLLYRQNTLDMAFDKSKFQCENIKDFQEIAFSYSQNPLEVSREQKRKNTGRPLY